MNRFLSGEPAAQFWKWFQSVSDQLAKEPENEDLHAEIDIQVCKLGSLACEIGPGKSKPWALTLSPGGDAELLSLTKAVVSAAPSNSLWEFNAAKQPKEWDFRFTVRDDNSVDRQIDARNWRYVLDRYSDGLIDVTIEAPNLSGQDDDFKNTATEIVLDGAIGEEDRLLQVHEIEVVDTLPDNVAARASPVGSLQAHWRQLKSRG
jgi:hypothetical protein